ncbi:MAG TPA: hypothetical protein VLA21_04865, partial [Candidatus Limnocylindria bacterium]|nr:hypothetical protein [Candidatus Limnocylindria bacterium]
PLDISADGEQTVPLIASNLYWAGEAKVLVEGGSVTVTYSVLPAMKVKSEFLAVLPNLDAAVTTDPAGLREYAHGFGERISIADRLGGDTRVLLFILNVVDYDSGAPGLRLFTDRNPAYRAAAEAYRALLE